MAWLGCGYAPKESSLSSGVEGGQGCQLGLRAACWGHLSSSDSCRACCAASDGLQGHRFIYRDWLLYSYRVHCLVCGTCILFFCRIWCA